jgi:uncharacterized membrane protein YccC
MSGILSTDGKRGRDRLTLRAIAQDWIVNEGERWIFVVKTLLAAFLALWISFLMGLDSPRSAMITVFIIALPSSGMALEKGIYRLIGTLVGCAAALAIVGLFPQQPLLLFLALAMWIGLCTGGSTLMRNARSYGFVLAGYTACMIALPAIDAPMEVFSLAIARVTEISLGILCTALINDAIFPKHQSEQLVKIVHALYHNFSRFCHDAMQGRLDDEQLDQLHLQFASQVAALESNRAAALFEAGNTRARSQQIYAFSAAAMVTLTTFHTLHQLMQRVRQRGDPLVPQLITPVFNTFSDALLVGDLPARSALEAATTREKLQDLGRRLPVLVTEVRRDFQRHKGSGLQQLDLDTALELIQRFQDEFTHLVTIYNELPGHLTARPRKVSAAALSYSSKTPPMIAVAAGLRASAALLILALAWYGLNWPSAADAVILTVVFCALASLSPDPGHTIRRMTQGFGLAIPWAFICAFHILNHVEGYLMLTLSMVPFLALSVYVTTWRGATGIGTGFSWMFAQIISPENLMSFNVVNFFNDSIAQIAGLLLALLMFALILPEHRQGSRRHIAEAMWRETLRICVSERPHLRHHFEGRMRDLMNQLNMGMRGLPAAATRTTLNQAITLLELGHAILDLRAVCARWPAGHAVRAAQEHCIAVLASYFRQQQPIRHAQAQAAVTVTTNALRNYQTKELLDPAQAVSLQRGLTDLHLIGTSLQDPSLRGGAVKSSMPKGSLHDAA